MTEPLTEQTLNYINGVANIFGLCYKLKTSLCFQAFDYLGFLCLSLCQCFLLRFLLSRSDMHRWFLNNFADILMGWRGCEMYKVQGAWGHGHTWKLSRQVCVRSLSTIYEYFLLNSAFLFNILLGHGSLTVTFPVLPVSIWIIECCCFLQGRSAWVSPRVAQETEQNKMLIRSTKFNYLLKKWLWESRTVLI